jgi:hypothetical protein
MDSRLNSSARLSRVKQRTRLQDLTDSRTKAAAERRDKRRLRRIVAQIGGDSSTFFAASSLPPIDLNARHYRLSIGQNQPFSVDSATDAALPTL